MSIVGSGANTDAIVQGALQISTDACDEISAVLTDIRDGNINQNAGCSVLFGTVNDGTYGSGQSGNTGGTFDPANPCIGATWTSAGWIDKGGSGPAAPADAVPGSYGVILNSDLSISTANGAMIIDDLMQKVSTKVQVAAQMLSTANTMAKTASRILSQG
jgi:hypothetical protein